MMTIKLYLIGINITSFLIMGLDKLLAIKCKKRVSEHILLTLSTFGGCIGTLFGMLLFRHKIRKPKFYIIIPISVTILMLLIITKKIPLT